MGWLAGGGGGSQSGMDGTASGSPRLSARRRVNHVRTHVLVPGVHTRA